MKRLSKNRDHFIKQTGLDYVDRRASPIPLGGVMKNFGQATPEKLAECIAQGMCLDMASGNCKPLGQCFDGYTPPGTLPPVDIPPTGGGGGAGLPTTQLPTGHTVIATTELDKLKSASDSRLLIGLGAGAGGLVLGGLLGWALSR